MSERKVLVKEEAKKRPPAPIVPDVVESWKWVGWLAGALALVGSGDFLLAWYPTAFGTPEWEFATVAQSFAGLPLVALGLFGLLGSAVAVGRRWLVWTAVALLAVAGTGILMGLVLFLTDVPLALGASEGIARTGIKKAIFKTVLLGLVFGGSFIWAAWMAARHVKRKVERTDA